MAEVAEMKFQTDPESRRAVTGRVMWAAVRWAVVVSGYILMGVGRRKLTTGRGG